MRPPAGSSALSPGWGRRYLARTVSVNLVWPLVLLGAVGTALSTGSLSSWCYSAALCVLLVEGYVLFGIPARAALLAPMRPLAAIGVIAVFAAPALRHGTLHGSFDLVDAVAAALVVALLALSGLDARRRLTGRSQVLRWPLPEGRWTVVEGTGTLPNHHWPAVAQRGALDLVGAVRGGRSTARLLPRDCADFAAFGRPVVAPCDGTVRHAVDGHPDRPDRGSPPPGNHVVIAADSGEEVVLGHLRSGSVAVSDGQRVSRGDPLGEVGNSGNSSEPHLHFHVVRDGRPLRPCFEGVRSSLRRNAVVRGR